MVGRKEEIKRIEQLLQSERSEFLAVTGRRRVGKTYLIDSLLKDHYCFSMTGIQNGSIGIQLFNFSVKLAEYEGSQTPHTFTNWQFAFLQLKRYLQQLDKHTKQVIFIDELPWVYTPKSSFLQLLAHLWNDYLSKEKHFFLVVCGSATSWITRRVINDPGGLHNRVTENIHLRPFSLQEAQDFLHYRGLQLNQQQLSSLYMSLGGIPFYLENIRRGETFSTSIERICFTPTGILRNEYENLFQALFSNAALHQAIVGVLAQHPGGLSTQAILQELGQSKASGSYTRAMHELQLSDFVQEYNSPLRKKRGSIYRLIDEYTIFYHRFIKDNSKYTEGIWQQLAASQSYKIWSGLAFEALCFKHINEIKKALGIAAVFTRIYSMNEKADPEKAGAQIDLIIDRNDNAINLCELKYRQTPFSLSKTEYEELLLKKAAFLAHTKSKKQLFITLITNYPLLANSYSEAIIDSHLSLEDIL